MYKTIIYNNEPANVGTKEAPEVNPDFEDQTF